MRLFYALVACALIAVQAVPASGGPSRRVRLPNLVPLAPDTFLGPTTDTDTRYFFGGGATVDGCTPDEIARNLARRCLRFDSILANVGPGPFEVAYVADPAHGGLAAHQRLYRGNGTTKGRFATQTEYHATHAHFHIKDVYVARLWRVDERRRVRGRSPIARSDKNGFCPEDTTPVEGDSGTRGYQCFVPDDMDSRGTLQVVGISPGWADIYVAELPDQYIEITNVPRGFYLFELEIDPHDYFVESSEKDNRVCLLLQLKGNSASPRGERRCPR